MTNNPQPTEDTKMLMINKPLTAEQRLQKCVTDILIHPRYVALAGVVLIGSRTVDETTPTACTNGRDEWYGRAFIANMPIPQLRYLILHETYHKLFSHLNTWEWMYILDAECANKACDFTINLKISDENTDGFAVMPMDEDGNPMGCIDEKYRDTATQKWDAAKIFLELYNKKKQEQESEGEGGGKGQGEGEGQDSGQGLDSHDWEGAQALSAQERADLKADIDQSIREGAITAGKLGTGVNRAVTELLEVQVDWRTQLLQWTTEMCRGNDDTSWRQISRRGLANNMLRPRSVSTQMEEILITGDLSGSVQREIQRYFTEFKAVFDNVQPKRVRVLYWDTEVCVEEVYGEGHTPLELFFESTTPKGGGGTDVTCVSKYIQEHHLKPTVVINFTDGHLGGVWGEWVQPVMWCIVNNKSAKPPMGTCLHVSI
jgi:predicted metal-dependent peptidase